MNIKTYILKKDLPDVKAGAEYIQTINSLGYTNGQSFFKYEHVENNPEWFEEKKEDSLLTHPIVEFKDNTYEDFLSQAIYSVTTKPI